MRNSISFVVLLLFMNSAVEAMKKRPSIKNNGISNASKRPSSNLMPKPIELISLTGSTDRVFEVSRSIADEAKTIFKTTSFPQYNDSEMELITKFMWALYYKRPENLTDKNLLDALERDIPDADPVRLLWIANYLDLKTMREFAAHSVIKKIKDTPDQILKLIAEPRFLAD